MKHQGSIAAIIILVAVLIIAYNFGLFKLGSTLSNQNIPYKEFEWKGLQWRCVGDLSSGSKMDLDFSDGHMQSSSCDQHSSSGTTYDCSTSVDATIEGDYWSMGSASQGKGGSRDSQLTCTSLNLSKEDYKKIEVVMSSQITVTGDGQCSTYMNRMGLSDSLACPNYPFTGSKSKTNVILEKRTNWVIYDINNEINSDFSQLTFSIGTSVDGGTRTATAVMRFNDLIFTKADVIEPIINETVTDINDTIPDIDNESFMEEPETEDINNQTKINRGILIGLIAIFGLLIISSKKK